MTARTMSLTVFLIFILSAAGYAADCIDGNRYQDNFNGTVTDCRTGLIWLKDANCRDTSGGIPKNDINGALTWYDAMKWVAGLGDTRPMNITCLLRDGSSAGDWRLPTKTEWMAMVSNAKKQVLFDPALTKGTGVGIWSGGDIFNLVQSSFYWSLTSVVSEPDKVWFMYLYDGSVGNAPKTPNTAYVWAVRDGQGASYGYLFVE
jgi:hypothetical protein